MHHWSDKDVDWQGIDEAATYIGEYIHFWGRMDVLQVKEKWGMVCVYCYGPKNKWQELVYRRAYKRAIIKWPHLRREILEGADWNEYLEDL